MTAGKGRRRLTEAEIEVWLAVARTVSPRRGSSLPERTVAPPVAAPAPPSAPEPRFRPPFLPPYSPPAQPRAPAPPLAPFEKRYRQKVTHGRVDIEGAIDLHGLTQPEAHDALRGFLRAAQARGARLLLVVTGKGRSRLAPGRAGEAESGVLRRAVPLWLRADDLRPIVLGFEEAGLPHGGHGALYVRLRRN